MIRAAVLFPGQGAQYPGMGAGLAQRSTAAAEVLRRASNRLGWDVLAACSSASMETLSRGDIVQPALVALGVAWYRSLTEESGFRADFLAGHSLGEITALACAGAFDLETALELAQTRGRLMKEASAAAPGTMCAVVGLPVAAVARACSDHDRPGARVVVSNENAEDQAVISGDRRAVQTVCASLEAAGAKIRPLEVEGAFHSPLMAEAARQFGKHLAGLEPQTPAVPVLSNVTARPHAGSAIPLLLQRQVTETVRWRSCFDFMVSAGVKLFVECGPGSVLTRLARRAGSGWQAFSLDEEDKRGVTRDWSGLQEGDGDFLDACLRAAAASPDRGADPEAFGRNGAPAYRELEELRLRVRGENRSPSQSELSRSLTLAQLILDIKQAPDRLAELGNRARQLGIKFQEFTVRQAF